MAHHSYLSPDGQWVLIVQMDTLGHILPCRVVPIRGYERSEDWWVLRKARAFQGHGRPDGKWIYLTVRTDDFHIWRQRFPDGNLSN